MAQVIALMIAAINGLTPSHHPEVAIQIQTASRGLQQASLQAPKVPLSQIIPASSIPQASYKSKKPKQPLSSHTSKSQKATNKRSAGACQTFQATVYGPPWGGIEGTGWSATGMKLVPGKHVIAVDPKVIPLHSHVTVWPNPHNWQGEFLAADTGGAIKGRIIDIFMWQGPTAMDQWGRRSVRVCSS